MGRGPALANGCDNRLSDFLIAEDSGMAGDAAIRLRDAYNLHGMSILQFDGATKPRHHLDHIPEVGIRAPTITILSQDGIRRSGRITGGGEKAGCNSADVPMEAVKGSYRPADIVVIPLQDVLGLGNS